MNILSLITSLGKAGKSPLEIARELHAQGMTTDRGKTITPDMVVGFLRFAGGSTDAGALPAMETVSGAVWGRGESSTYVPRDSVASKAPKQKRPKGNIPAPGSNFTDEQKAEIARLYQHEGMKAADIAAKLGINVRRVNPYCAHLAGFSVPPGGITEYVDTQGHTVTKYPPAWAIGVYPQRNVGGS